MRRGGKAFGIILIVLGGLFLLGELGVLDEFYARYNITAGAVAGGILGAIMTLWPLILVALGITILFRNEWVSRITWIALIVIMMAYAIAAPGLQVHRGMMWLWNGGWDGDSNISTTVREISETIEYTGAMKKGSIDIELGAGTAIISSIEDKAAKLESKGRILDYDWDVDDETLNIDVGSEDVFGNFESLAGEYKIYLGDELPWDIDIETGASDFNADFRDLQVDNIDFSVGAGSVVLHLGDLQPLTNVTVEAGASSIEIYVPENAGVSLKSDSGLSSVTMDGNDLASVGSGSYKSQDYDDASSKVNIILSAGVSSVDIIRE